MFTDIDECNNHSHVCDVNANCININGSHNCTCKEGYIGDGQSSCKGTLDWSNNSSVCNVLNFRAEESRPEV